MNKRRMIASLFLSVLLIIVSNISVKAQENNNDIVYKRLGNTSMNAINLSKIAYEKGIVYSSLNIDDRHSLYKHTLSTGKTEKVLDNEMYCLNVLDGIVYGFIDNSSYDDKASGIYKINTTNNNELTLVYEVESAYNILVVEDYIYFLTENEYGDTDLKKIKVDGSNYEVVLEKQINSFTFYKNNLYLLTNEGLLKAEYNEGNTNFTCLSTNLDTNYITTFTICEDYIYLKGNQYKNNDKTGIYKISINDPNDIIYVENTEKVYDFEITDKYLICYDYDDAIFRISLDGKECKKIFQSYEISQLTSYNNLIYILTYEHINNTYEDQLWKIDVAGNNEKIIIPKMGNDYHEVKNILTKTSESMKNVGRYDADFVITDNRINEQIEITNTIKYRVDKKNKIMNERFTSEYSKNDKSKKSTFNQWVDDKNIYYSNNNKPWRFIDYKKEEIPLYKDIFNLYNFIDDGSDFCSKLKLDEDDENYILQGENSFSRQHMSIENNYWLRFFVSNLYCVDTYKYTVHINKKNYRIQQVEISSTQYEYGEPVGDITLKATNKYIASGKLQISNSVFDSLKNLAKANDYIEKASKANKAENYKQAIKYCETALDIDEVAIYAYKEKALALYKQGKTEEALEQLQILLDNRMLEDIYDVYLLFIEIYDEQNDTSTALEYVNLLEALDYFNKIPEKETSEYVNDLITISECYIGCDMYSDALPYIDRALEFDSNNALVKSYKMAILLGNEEYEKLLDYTNEQLEKDEEKDNRYVYYYNGRANLLLGNNNKAILSYNKAKKCKEDMIDDYCLFYDYALYYLALGKYDLAEIYTNKLDGDYYYHRVTLNAYIEEKEKSTSRKTGQFVLDNYLYMNEDIESKTIEFMGNQYTEIEDIENYINNIKKDDDKFTFFVKVNDTDNDEEMDEVTYKKIDDSTEYIKIATFANETSSKFINYVEQIKRPYRKTLIIDLRGNMGGLTSAATEILDIFLEDCSPCYFVNRYGYTTNIYSDYNKIPFKEIKVLVDNDSASSSELLALGLRKFADNVELLGKTTYGKGVAQDIYFDDENRFVLFLVSSYWNILEENINGIGIEPDIIVEGNDLEDFLKVIREEKKPANIG
ncbi:hypothetical protein SH1V18_44440 [Vallitalea longa]|uniref:Tail specific protease domain-containing protein n=1 Tax=Vallitalea longa TaxID=2936439 RepID=A0A9W5YF80_9FIRM|nr:S41 family peptidase [Vallitalea longa]GKX31964.1 hypothetical protein SH1V18_44440 [Vallitalea longa]